jgi:hypothetical protein
MESFMLSHNPRFLRLLDRAAEKTERQGGTSLSELAKKLPRSKKTVRRRTRASAAK